MGVPPLASYSSDDGRENVENRYLKHIVNLIQNIDAHQGEHIDKASDLMAECLAGTGIIQAFGSGHSYGSAMEIVERAGGLIRAKMIKDPSLGIYETIEGVGSILMRKVDIRPEDVVIIISYSGRNPMVIEIAEVIKQKGAKIIAITSLSSSKNLKSRHSNGKMLYDYADVILDMMGVDGDAAMEVDALPAKVCPASSIAAAALIQATVLNTMEKLIKKGIEPEIRVSANLDGGLERSMKIQKKYEGRIFRI